MTYRFYPRADAAQDKIEKWGEIEAVTYIKGLHIHLQRLR